MTSHITDMKTFGLPSLTDTNILVGYNLFRLVKTRGYSLHQLALLLGFSFSQLESYIYGQQELPGDILFALAIMFDTSVDYFYKPPDSENQSIFSQYLTGYRRQFLGKSYQAQNNHNDNGMEKMLKT